ncbi:MAG: tetratricopeptide repeat protein [Ignavibacteria bacterium]|nr:tetratricopeptide repeat protein [Ignavibacteria bacterium]
MTHEELEVILKQVEEQNKNGNYEDVEQLCYDVLESLVEGEELSLRSRILRFFADSLFRRGRSSDALPIAEESLSSAEQVEDKQEVANSMNLLGIVHSDLDDFTCAIEYFTKALAVNEGIGNKADAAVVNGNIGNVHNIMGDYPRAFEYFAKALAAHEELGNKADATNVTGNIGIVHYNMRDYSRALEYFAKVLTAFEELGKKAAAALANGNIGHVYNNMADYPRALEYYAKALVAFEELGMKADAVTITGGIGGVHYSMGDYTRAMEYFASTLGAFEKLGMRIDAARVTGNIGSAYANKEFDGYDAAMAEKILLKSLAMIEEIGAKRHAYEVHKNLAVLYEQQKRWKKHSFHFKKYHEIYLEVQSEEATQKAQLMEHRRKVEEASRDRQIKLARFQEQEKILHNILPSKIAERMVAGEKTIADSYQSVSVLFADIVGFTKLSQRITPEELVAGLDSIFNTFDHLSDKYGCEKIKTIGDCYMVVSGLPDPAEDHAIRLGSLALEMIDAIQELPSMVEDVKVNMRIGLHSGSVVAGIIGKNKYAYDLWGDAVNTASRMESHGEPGKIHVSEEFMRALSLSSPTSTMSPMSLHFQERGEMEIKGKGMMKTYFLEKANE